MRGSAYPVQCIYVRAKNVQCDLCDLHLVALDYTVNSIVTPVFGRKSIHESESMCPFMPVTDGWIDPA